MDTVTQTVTQTEIARRVGVTHQAVSLWSKKPGFPIPVRKSPTFSLYRWVEVRQWIIATGRVLQT